MSALTFAALAAFHGACARGGPAPTLHVLAHG